MWRCVALTLLTVGARAPRSATGKLRSPLMNNATQGLRRLAAYNIDEVDKLTADAAAAGDSFGWSVAIAGNTVVVGAYQYNNGGSGAAYVLRTTDGGATYGQVAKLTAADAAAYDSFGYSVAIDGSTVVVGAHAKNSGRGAVYVFRTSDGGATYAEVAKLTASDAAASDNFGYSVAIAGATVVIGASSDADAGSSSGSAYVFQTSDSGATYGQVAKLTASDAAAGDYFGWSVAVDGSTVVVGATQWLNAGSGVAYIFRTSDGGATYAEVVKLTAADAAEDDWFGVSVAIEGDTVVIGAYLDDDSGPGSGSAYIFDANMPTSQPTTSEPTSRPTTSEPTSWPTTSQPRPADRQPT